MKSGSYDIVGKPGSYGVITNNQKNTSRKFNYIDSEKPTIIKTQDGNNYYLGRVTGLSSKTDPQTEPLYADSPFSDFYKCKATSIKSEATFECSFDEFMPGIFCNNVITEEFLNIDKIIFGGDVTKVIFKDGSSTSVTRKHANPDIAGDTEDEDDREVAVMYCLMKKAIPGFKRDIRKKIAIAKKNEEKAQKNREERMSKKQKKQSENNYITISR